MSTDTPVFETSARTRIGSGGALAFGVIASRVKGIWLQNTGDMMQRSELFAAFESIGNNCEFGIVQDAAGYRALSLFSNVGFDSVTCITEAISCGLDGMFSEGAYEFSKPEGWPDYAVHCLRFGFIFHTGLYISEAASHSELPRRVQALCRLKEKFLSDLRDGSKIFVYRGPEGANEHLARRLASCIRAHGPGRLLWVYEDSRPERRFAWVEPSRLKGLLFGGMPHLSNSAPVRIAYDAWESIARQSLAMFSTQSFPLSAPKIALTAQEASEPRNLALYCPTRQSSVSQWSNANQAEADSAGAVNGRLDQTYGFHTDEEDNPWWQVDLRQNCILDSILIHNRVDHVSISHRTFPLSILLSLDENEWTLVHTASADTSSGGLDSRPVIWRSPEHTVARYVRLQVARRSMLHLVQVEVLGSLQQAAPKKRSSAT